VGSCGLMIGAPVTSVKTVMNLRLPQKAGNFLANCVTVSFSRVTLLCGVAVPYSVSVRTLATCDSNFYPEPSYHTGPVKLILQC
jgi:hypothetical protein